MTLPRILFLLTALFFIGAVHADPRVDINSPSVNLTDFRIGYFIDDSRELTYAQAREQQYTETTSTTTLGTNALVT